MMSFYLRFNDKIIHVYREKLSSSFQRSDTVYIDRRSRVRGQAEDEGVGRKKEQMDEKDRGMGTLSEEVDRIAVETHTGLGI